jgi:hypothetical protein
MGPVTSCSKFSKIAAQLAEKNSITKKQAVEILEFTAALACKHAKDSFRMLSLGGRWRGVMCPGLKAGMNLGF